MASEHHEERTFGLGVGAVFTLLGGWWTVRGRFPVLGPTLLCLGLLLLACGALRPRLLVLPRRGWMALAEALSFVTTRIVLFVVFVLVLTPIGIARRLLGADPLRRRAPRSASGWRPSPRRHLDPGHFEKMF